MKDYVSLALVLAWMFSSLVAFIWSVAWVSKEIRLRHKKKDSGLVLVRGEEEPKRLTLIYHKGYAAEFNPDREWAERWCIFSRYLDEEGAFYTDSGEHADELLRFFAGPEEGGQG